MVDQIALAVDVVCFTLTEGRLDLLLTRRTGEPFAGFWALPGGIIEDDEPLDDAAARILRERTGASGAYLEQLYTFGDPDRDPRGRTISVTYYALLPSGGQPVRLVRGAGPVAWCPANDLPPLAFDHARIAAYARWRLSQKMTYTPLPFFMLPDAFTMGDLRGVHEAVDAQEYDPSNFARQMLARWDLAPVPGERDRRTRRPARLFRYIGPRDIAGSPNSTAPRSESGPDILLQPESE